MNRLRRRNAWHLETPIAAEVLETRSLLSGAAAVHAAVHHALTPQVIPPGPTAAVKGTFLATLKVNGSGPAPEAGVVSLQSINPVDGATVKGSFTTSVKTGAASLVEKTTFSGKVVNAVTVAGLTTLTIQPSGGAYAVTVKAPGHATISASAPPTTSYTITIFNGDVTDVTAHYKFSASAGGGLANHTVDFDLSF